MAAVFTFTFSCLVTAALCQGASNDKPQSWDANQDSDSDLSSLVQLTLQRGTGKERAEKPLGAAAEPQHNATSDPLVLAQQAEKLRGVAAELQQSVTSDPLVLAQHAEKLRDAAAELQQNATADPLVLAQQAPVKSFPGAGEILKFPEWRHDIDLGFRQKLHDLAPRFRSECLSRGFGTETECDIADDELRTLIWATTNATDENILTGARVRLGITWFIWQPGPPMSFNLIDQDHNEMLTFKELVDVFGLPTMLVMLPLMRFLDTDGDGNTTRDELYHYLHASVLVRDQLPQVDQVYPEKSTQEVLTQLQRIYFKPHLPEQLNRVTKVLILLGTAITSIVVVGYFSCSGNSPRAK